MFDFLKDINLIQIYILCTLLFSITLIKYKRLDHKLLLLVLGLSFMNEIIFYFGFTNVIYIVTTNIYLIVIICIWLYMLLKLAIKKSRYYTYVPVWVFILFAIINTIFMEGITNFNYFTPVVGVLIYIVLFFGISFQRLKKENFIFFYNNQYILLAAPVFFLLGLGIVFSFQDPNIPKVEVIFSLTLYQLINYLTNIIFYTLINIYIIKERKQLAHAC